jgi:hypothetical protein
MQAGTDCTLVGECHQHRFMLLALPGLLAEVQHTCDSVCGVHAQRLLSMHLPCQAPALMYAASKEQAVPLA